MDRQAIEVIETEIVLEETRSANHSHLIHRLGVALLPYEGRYDIMPELEFELAAGDLRPDVALVTKTALRLGKGYWRYPGPPVTAIEIIYPTQSMNGLVIRICESYFRSGVQSVWLVLPTARTIHLYLPNQPVQVLTTGILLDPVSGVEVEINKLFR